MSIEMRQFLIAVMLRFGVVAQTLGVGNHTCLTETPYRVYEFTKSANRFLMSIPLLECNVGPAKKIVKFNCLTSGDDLFHEINFTDANSVRNLNMSRKFGFIAHGFLGDCYSDWPIEMMRVWADSEPINVCCVDWSEWAKCNYITDAGLYVYKVGKYLARTIQFLGSEYSVDTNDVVLVGHSFGGIIIGVAGKSFVDPQLPLCIALDPAGYGFTKPVLMQPDRRLAATDCKVVKALYTDKIGLGSSIIMGSTNIVANGGNNQPQCVGKFFPCDHLVATIFFIESIRKDRISNYTMVSHDGTVSDVFTTYAKDIPGNYSITTSKCYPYFRKSHNMAIANERDPIPSRKN